MSRIYNIPTKGGAVSIVPHRFAKKYFRQAEQSICREQSGCFRTRDELSEEVTRRMAYSLSAHIKPELKDTLSVERDSFYGVDVYKTGVYIFSKDQLRDYAIELAEDIIKQCKVIDEDSIREKVASEITSKKASRSDF